MCWLILLIELFLRNFVKKARVSIIYGRLRALQFMIMFRPMCMSLKTCNNIPTGIGGNVLNGNQWRTIWYSMNTSILFTSFPCMPIHWFWFSFHTALCTYLWAVICCDVIYQCDVSINLRWNNTNIRLRSKQYSKSLHLRPCTI